MNLFCSYGSGRHRTEPLSFPKRDKFGRSDHARSAGENKLDWQDLLLSTTETAWRYDTQGKEDLGFWGRIEYLRNKTFFFLIVFK